MDLILIGQFLKEQRKLKKLTQQELANKLGVSEKTISKWECGNGLPDATLMIPLCDELGISVNELLSGKKLAEKDYKANAEQNFMELKSQQEKTTKFLLKLECVVGYFASITFLILVFIASFCQLSLAVRIILIVVGLILFCIGVHFCLIIEKDAGYYKCSKCEHKYIPTYNQVLWAMHMGRTRFMKCPKCGKKSWHKKVI